MQVLFSKQVTISEIIYLQYGRTRFNGNNLTAAKIATKNDRNHWNLL